MGDASPLGSASILGGIARGRLLPCSGGPGPTDLTALGREIEAFIETASAQLYVIPNRVVPKRERSKWRFRVMRYLKELSAATPSTAQTPLVADLLEALFGLLSRACVEYLFSSEDPFSAVRVTQSELLDRVLTLRRAHQSPRDFVPHGLTLATATPLDRYTLRSGLLRVLLAHLRTPALRELTIAECTLRIEKLAAPAPAPAKVRPRSGGLDYRERYRRQALIDDLAEMGLRCHFVLCEPEEAIAYFERHWGGGKNAEVRLFVLLQLLAGHDEPRLWAREYDRAVAAGVQPRQALRAERARYG